jgi:hypothetical protein|tara:strand:+ start:1291 stop:1428 length:138 start_codon:yes stop_codon:yes gene_type:complete
MKNKAAQKLGQLSAKKRKEQGHDSEYYRQLVKKRWDKNKKEKKVQ